MKKALATDVVEINNASSLKLKFDCGENNEGKRIIKSRSFSNVKSKSQALDVYNVALTLASLQEHTLIECVKQDNTSLNA